MAYSLKFAYITIAKYYRVIGYSGITSEDNVEIPSIYDGPNGKHPVKSINSSAFENCSSLTSITIPSSVTSISDWTFHKCSSLTSITIPNTVKSIGSYAFSGCSSLTSVTIPNKVTSIGSYAFSGCWNLAGVYITDIAAWCKISFSNDTSNPLYYGNNLYLNNQLVTELIIPSSVVGIGSYAFSFCRSLTNITIPDTVVNIGGNAFYHCSNLINIFVDENNQEYKSIDGNLYTNDGTTLIQYAIGKTEEVFNIPNTVITIGDSAFDSCKLKLISIPRSVRVISNYAFYGSSNLTYLIIPNSVDTIGTNIFFISRPNLTVFCEDIAAQDKWDLSWYGNLGQDKIVWNYLESDVVYDNQFLYNVTEENGLIRNRCYRYKYLVFSLN